MFRFNFHIQGYANDSDDEFADPPEVPLEIAKECHESKRVPVAEEHFENIAPYRECAASVQSGATEMLHLPSFKLKVDEVTNEIQKANDMHTDLLPGVYEGGAKIWESTYDLLKFFSKNIKPYYFKGKRVLDLGCGAGILGIFALKNDSIVEFQDYNEGVLHKITIPNVMLNVPCPDKKLREYMSKIPFYSGDWNRYCELTKYDKKFDIILTSETIYNIGSYKKLLDVFKGRLDTNGVVLLAAKVCYFGVGGGLRQFEDYVKADGIFTVKTIWQSTYGVHREILQIQYNESMNMLLQVKQ